jgi:hypothetical protein
MPPETPRDYLDRAIECERLAEGFEDPRARETMYYVAASWRALARTLDHGRKPSKTDGASPPPTE